MTFKMIWLFFTSPTINTYNIVYERRYSVFSIVADGLCSLGGHVCVSNYIKMPLKYKDWTDVLIECDKPSSFHRLVPLKR